MQDKILQGNNNETQLVDDRIIKTPKGISCAYERGYEKQVKQWNLYYKGTPYASACITPDNQLSTPFILGRVPSDEEVLPCLKLDDQVFKFANSAGI